MSDIRIGRGVSIPEHEIELNFSRSGGPGGQKANTSATKVELRFDLEASRSLTAAQKIRIAERLGNRVTKDNILVLKSSEHRTQGANRKAVIGRFRNLLRDALRREKRRKRTRPPKSADRRRLENKRQQGEKKRLRKSPKAPPDW